ncbi:Protein of uncharacterised function DUF72 [Legionella lansingensis]|uniref:DUF72 domain-containing protein n=1 Tax=Legionella lansingensis TaxID=45067 RepID=A0A0W0VVR5_9GAMM|nr:DUF72 domain-containing protein [Legionella lansingensis]KTD23798.1 hypothetical protein Llan_0579 [Legionella lansingensis]SNV47020.1 Protein of uncharacterised function DUF72 [Legionella lansingensis]
MPFRGFYIGTSGWSFKGWIGDFYPDKIIAREMLGHYANFFETVELNTSFYGTPRKKTIESWYEATPDNFIFSCKASRYITHLKRLKNTKESLTYLLKALEPFGKKLGPILFQLPPRWPVDIERLQNFVKLLPQDHYYTFEFRDKSWLCQSVYDVLHRHKIALCFYDYKGYQSPELITSNFIYIRLHGPESQPYQGHYNRELLSDYADKFIHWQEEAKPVFCYFDNDEKVCAPHDAMVLIQELSVRV